MRVFVCVALVVLFCVALATDVARSAQRCHRYQREDAVKCALKYGDRNHDERLSFKEVERERERALYWYEKVVAWIAVGHSTEKVFERCDHNRDGYIDAEDFAKSTATCLADCEAVEQFMTMICLRLAALTQSSEEVPH